jgi:hypothetical protein
MQAIRFRAPFLASLFTVVLSSPMVAQNIFHGSCTELPGYISQTGVVNDLNVPIRDKAGWTNAHFSYTVTYANPHRVPGSGKQACFHATAHITYISTPVTTMIKWEPVGCDPCACNAERDDWQARLANHELIHAQEANAAAASLTTFSTPLEVTACPTRPTANWLSVKSKFDAQVFTKAKRESRLALKAYSLSQDQFDSAATGQVPFPNCVRCPACAPGEQPACKECPAGLVLYKGNVFRSAARL